jgi:putative membrane protein
MTRLFLLTAATLSLATVASAQDRKPADKAYSDAEFVNMATQCGMLEVKLAKLAASNSKSEAVKALAKKLYDDHSQVNDSLAKVAKSAKLEVPTKMNEECTKKWEKFEAYKDNFDDKEYVAHVIKGHEEAIAWCNKAVAETKNADLKEYVAKLIPILQGHLDMAKKI